MSNAKLKCNICKGYFKRETIIKNNIGNFCSTDCLTKKGLQLVAKKRKEKNKQFKNKVLINDIKKQKELTQNVFNKMRVLEEKIWFLARNLKPICISCQKELGNDVWACGHIKSRGSNSALRFDRKNTYIQHNFSCNKHKSGDIDGAKRGIILRFGEYEGEKIIDYFENHERVKKWKSDELILMRKEFNIKIRKLKNEMLHME